MKVIAVTGTPGTGKTTLSKRICRRYGFRYIDVTALIKRSHLADSYDKKKKCYVVDIKKLNKALIALINASSKSMVIDSHLSHNLPSRLVDLCIVTKCSLKTLKHRLEKKGYSNLKVRENLDCEIFDICLNEAREAGHKIRIIDTSKRFSLPVIR